MLPLGRRDGAELASDPCPRSLLVGPSHRLVCYRLSHTDPLAAIVGAKGHDMRSCLAMTAIAAGLILAGATGAALAQTTLSPGLQQPSRAAPLRLFDRTQIIVKFRDGADPAAVMADALSGDRESYRPGGSVDFAAQATGAAVVDLSGILSQQESGRGRFAVERPRTQESTPREPIEALVERLNADPRVEYAEKNYLETLDQSSDIINSVISGGQTRSAGTQQTPPPAQVAFPNDPFFHYQWHLKHRDAAITEASAPGAVNFPSAWARYQPQRTVVIAVVDSGQVYAHRDLLTDAMLPGYDMISHPFVANDGDERDADPTDPGDGVAPGECFEGSPGSESSWHGSHVSGIAGAAASNNGEGIAGPLVSGIAIVPVRALGRCGGLTSDLADGLMWAAGFEVPGVPINPNPATVINASFGGLADECRPVYQDALRQIRARGAIVVTTSGNEGFDAQQKSPANCEDALTVAASDMNGRLAPYSNYGHHVDILAPGGDNSADLDGNGFPDGILSIVAEGAGVGQAGYDFFEGTSMAAPVVTAALALALAHNADWTVEDAIARLVETAIPRSGAECPQPCGAGLLDASALID